MAEAGCSSDLMEEMFGRKVMIVGHSYVTRMVKLMKLKQEVSHQEMITADRGATIRFFGVSGATVRDFCFEKYDSTRSKERQICRFWEQMEEFKPNITVILLGGNDLLQNTEACAVKEDFWLLYERITTVTPGSVIWVSIECRTHVTEAQADMGEGNPLHPKYVTQEKYDQKRRSINLFMARRMSSWARSYFLHLNHDEVFGSAEGYMSDGIHMGDYLLKLLWRKIQGAIDYAWCNPRPMGKKTSK